MSLIYMMKSVVDNVLPCGIPCVIIDGVEVAYVVWVDCMRLVKYDLKSERVSGWKLKSFCNLDSSVL